jgi:2-polyprenyl-3-methyl-5-hydroxy-6-metoxy-1,4-benzoquinol methylase
LLEIGCGDGKRLEQFRHMGWRVQGLEVDEKAAARARQLYGLPVHLGPLSEVELPEKSFDALIMNHVIEHLNDPLAVLRECLRVLKPGGKLVAVTPNCQSLGHKWFGFSWLGLDPPRHLYLFSPGNLHEVASRAAFQRVKVHTSAVNAKIFAEASFAIKYRNRYRDNESLRLLISFAAACFQVYEMRKLISHPLCGDECVLVAQC